MSQHLTGSNLIEHIEKAWGCDPLSEEAARAITYDVAKGLQHLHSNSIIHRNVKPENILLEKNSKSTARITEFSHAVKLAGNTKCEGMVGTLPYIAPEVLFEMPYD